MLVVSKSLGTFSIAFVNFGVESSWLFTNQHSDLASSNDLGVGVWLLVLNDQTVFEVEVRVEIDESLGTRWIVWDEELESVTSLPDRGFGVDGNALVLVGVGVNLDVTSLLFNMIVTIGSQNVVQSLVLAQFRSGIFAEFDISNTIAIETVL